MPEKDESSPGSHSFWSGTITFGLVSVPVQLFPANRSGGVHWRMLAEDGTPLKRRYFCPEENRELRADELVRGFEIADDEYVVVTDKELEGLAPRKSRDMDLTAFVDEDQLNPLYFERSYFLAPDSESNKAYRLLSKAMEKTKQAGIGTFVMRDKEYLVAIFSADGLLRAETLRFQDEVRDPKEAGLAEAPIADKKQVAAMLREIEKVTESKLKPSLLQDELAERIERLLEKKRKAHKDTVKIESPAEDDEQEASPHHLFKKLMRSISDAGSSKRKHKPVDKHRISPEAPKKASRGRKKRQPA